MFFFTFFKNSWFIILRIFSCKFRLLKFWILIQTCRINFLRIIICLCVSLFSHANIKVAKFLCMNKFLLFLFLLRGIYYYALILFFGTSALLNDLVNKTILFLYIYILFVSWFLLSNEMKDLFKVVFLCYFLNYLNCQF